MRERKETKLISFSKNMKKLFYKKKFKNVQLVDLCLYEQKKHLKLYIMYTIFYRKSFYM